MRVMMIRTMPAMMIRIMAKNRMMVVDGNYKCLGCHKPIAAAVGLDALLLDRLETAATNCKKNYSKKNFCDAITQIKMIIVIIMMTIMIVMGWPAGSIPDICHERHENSRVNFFWPV